MLGRPRFEDIASSYDFALMIPQRDTERLLIAHLHSLGVDVERNLRAPIAGVAAMAAGLASHARVVVEDQAPGRADEVAAAHGLEPLAIILADVSLQFLRLVRNKVHDALAVLQSLDLLLNFRSRSIEKELFEQHARPRLSRQRYAATIHAQRAVAPARREDQRREPRLTPDFFRNELI